MQTPAGRLCTLWLCITIVFATSTAAAQQWVNRYDGPGHLSDRARAIALDDSGHVYATGWTTGLGGSDDMTTIKYAATGDTLWVRHYDGTGGGQDRSRALAFDPDGNVFVTGHTTSTGSLIDFMTIKYSAAGDVLWARSYNGPGNGDDRSVALAVDSGGNCYVTGESWNGTNSDMTTIKYSPTGDTLWVRHYNGPGDGFDVADGIAIAGDTAIYVGGLCTGIGTSFDMLVVKYSALGDVLWDRAYNGPGNGDDEVRALAVDDAGQVCVTGYSTGLLATLDMITLMISGDGDSLWAHRYEGPALETDQAWEVAFDPVGAVYVTGASAQIGQDRDCTTIKYSESGDVLWMRHYNGPGGGRDVAYGLTVDLEGNAYVAGCARVDSSADYDKNDFVTIKYSPSGDTLWLRRFNGPGNAGDVVWDVAVDDSGDVYVCGHSVGDTTSYDFVTMKYHPCAVIVPGDVNQSTTLTSADIIYLVNHIYRTGAPPLPCAASGDVDCSGEITSADLIFMVNHVFHGQAPPCDACNSALAVECP